MAPAIVSGNVRLESRGQYIFASFCILAFDIGEMRRPSGTWMRTELKVVGCEVISNAPVGVASRSGLMGWVV